MKKKIAILIYSLASGGAERVVSLLIPELMQSYQIYLVLMNKTIEYTLPGEITPFFLETSKVDESGITKLLKLPFLAYQYSKFCKENKIDLSFSFLSRPNYINILASPLMKKTKIILSERSMPSMQYAYPGLQSSINKKLISWLYPLADLIITNSQGNQEDLKKYFNIKIPMISIYNPLDLDNIDKECKKVVEESTLFDSNYYTFITVGRLDVGKNHQLLIQAMETVTDVKLIIIGDGVLRRQLQQQIEDMGLQDRVFILGKRRNPYSYMARSDAFVFASNHEGFPNVLLEALACELPIVSTDCPSGPREILAPETSIETVVTESIEYAKFGILVPRNHQDMMIKAMLSLKDSPDLANKYRKTAKIRATDFKKQDIIQQYIIAIKGVLFAK